MPDTPRLKKIKSGVLSRGLALAKVSVAAGARAASHSVGGWFAAEGSEGDRLRDLLISQMGLLTRELGQLKGSVMKVGQMLSMYGEHFLPPEANAALKSLQSQSPPLEWREIEKQIRRQLGEEKMALLEMDHEPLASASLGQVHRARLKADGRELVMKIQYPGVDKAIDADINALQKLLSLSKLIPRGPRYDELFREVRSMLHQEVDYRKELEATDFFRSGLKDDPRYIIAGTFPELSTSRILTSTYELGIPVDSPEVLALPQERRNAIALAALDLYFRELFEFRLVQTDPHFGNYRVRLGDNGAPDRLVLFDFGAVRKVPHTFLDPYRILVRGAYDRDEATLVRGAEGLGFLQPGDSDELKRHFIDLCMMIMEPFADPGQKGVARENFDADGAYDWAGSDLPKRVAQQVSKIVFSFKARVPPREVVFLDRKMGGVFIFMKVLQARVRAREQFGRYILPS